MDYTIICSYGFLLMAVIALWFNVKLFGKLPLWIAMLAVAFIFAISFKYASFVSLLYTSVFGLAAYLNFKRKNHFYFIVTLGLCIPLLWHMPIIGFNNYEYLNSVKITENASPYSLYFNFDKTLIALFILGFAVGFKKINFALIFRKLFIYLLAMVALLLVIAFILGYTRFEPKIPSFTLIWVLVNLFFVCTAEEALFRRLIQDKINLLKSKYAYIIAIVVSSVLFGLAHYKGGFAYIILASIAGLFYAHIYYKTRRVESSILLHFAFNLVHFLLFTYPSL